jgi:hypothetical protein
MAHIINWPLAWRTARHIINCPENWDQSVYISPDGYASCFMGRIALLNGWFPVWNDEYEAYDGVSARKDGITLRIPDIAFAALELFDHDDYLVLEDYDNSLFDILNALADWAADDGQEIPDDISQALAWAAVDVLTD